MRIRKFRKEDVEQVCKIISGCDKEITSKDYPSNVIEALVNSLKKDNLIKENKQRLCFVAVKKGKIRGHISFENKEIKKLHVDPDFLDQGIGKKLLKKIFKYCKRKKINKIFVKSTIFAEEFYCKFGFVRRKNVFENIGGEKFKLVLMEKEIK